MKYLVTGANRANGLGAEMVRQLLARGHDVIATARDPAKAEVLAELGKRHAGKLTVHALDVSNEASVNALGKAVSEVDVLINNAGTIGERVGLGKLTQDELLHTFTVNAMGPLLLAQALIPALSRGK